MSTLQDVVGFVRSLGTWMDVRIEENAVQIDTRDDGNVGDGRPGQKKIVRTDDGWKRVSCDEERTGPDLNRRPSSSTVSLL